MQTKQSVLIVLVLVVFLLAGCSPAPEITEPEPTTIPTQAPTATTLPPTEIPTVEATIAPSPEPTAIPDSWVKYIGSNRRDDFTAGAVQMGNGNFAVLTTNRLGFGTGGNGELQLRIVNPNGEILLEKIFESEESEFAEAIQLAENGDLFFSGTIESEETDGIDLFLMRVSPDGEELFKTMFSLPLDQRGIVHVLSDGSYLLGGNQIDPEDIVVDDPGLAGYGGFTGRSNLFIAKFDATENQIWLKTYGGQKNLIVDSVLPTQDGGFIALATNCLFPEPGDDLELYKLDAEGNQEWLYIWDEATTNGGSAIQTSDGNYLIAAGYSTETRQDLRKADNLLIKVDPNGEAIFTEIYGDPDIVDACDLIYETENADFVCVMEISRDLTTYESDLKLMQFSADGQPGWETIIDVRYHTMMNSLFQTPDGRTVIAGTTYTGSGFDTILVKTDPDGNLQ